MTTYTITLSGPSGTHDITSRTRVATWERALGEASSTLQLDSFNIDLNHVMDAVTLNVDGVLLFSGTVKEQDDTKTDTLKVTRMRSVDGTDKLQRRLVAEVYTNKTPKEIIVDLCTKYASWINTSAVKEVGGVIEQIVFNYDTLAAAIGKLSEMTGAYWYLDAANALHFFDSYESAVGIEFDATRPNSILRNTFNLRTTALDLANRVWVIGAKAAGAQYVEQQWTGDGVNAVFTIAYEPNYPDVWENGVSKTIEVEKGEGSTKDYVYNKKEKALKRVAGPLPSGVTVKLKYRPTVQIIDYFEDTPSITKYGLFEKAIRDKKITDKMAARNRGRAALRKTKSTVRLMSWETHEWQNLSPGQLVQVRVPSFGVDSQARIDRISVTFTPAEIRAQIEATEVLI